MECNANSSSCSVFEKCSFYKSAHEGTKKFKLGITTHYTTAIESKASSTLKHKISNTEDKNECRLSVQPSGKYSFWIKHPLVAIITTCLKVRLASRQTGHTDSPITETSQTDWGTETGSDRPE